MAEEIYTSCVCPKEQIIRSVVIIAFVASGAGETSPQARVRYQITFLRLEVSLQDLS